MEYRSVEIRGFASKGTGAYDPITLEREIVQGDLDFQVWASEVVGGGSGYRRDVTITLLDGQHNVAVGFKLSNCWPSAYEAVSELNADTSHVAIERLTLECDSFSGAMIEKCSSRSPSGMTTEEQRRWPI